jgi:tripartite-type tricarboxylate transporter receptor subunit TctC
MHRRTFLGTLSAAGLALTPYVRAQNAPTRIVVGATPGGGTDTISRALAVELGKVLGGTFVVDNKPGAGGNIAAQYVANAGSDGKVLLMCYTSHAINASLYRDLPFDPVQDFTPICYVAYAPSLLIANPKIPANDVSELTALAKERPGELNIALPGIGSAGHLAAEVLRSQAGIDIATIPYKGTAPALNDVVSGEVDLMFAGLALANGQIQANKVKAIGVSSATRVDAYPDVAAIAEVMPGYDFSAWYGLLGPAGMDPALAMQISEATRSVLRNEGMREKLRNEGLMATGSTPEEFTAFLRQEITRWGKVVEASGATAG